MPRHIDLLPLPWWRRLRHLSRLMVLLAAAHVVVMLAFEPLRMASLLALGLTALAALWLVRPEAAIGWRADRIEIRAGRHRWSTPASAIDLESAVEVLLPPPGDAAPEPGRGEFRKGAWLGPARWPAHDFTVFCAARPGPALLVPVSPTQALVLSGPEGVEALRTALAQLLDQQEANAQT